MEEQERRRDVRARINIPTFLVRRGAAEPLELRDASYRGLFLRMEEAPPVRQLVKLRVKLPTKELELHAVVVRVVEEPSGKRGVGVRFFALNGQDRADWESFITSVLHGRVRAA